MPIRVCRGARSMPAKCPIRTVLKPVSTAERLDATPRTAALKCPTTTANHKHPGRQAGPVSEPLGHCGRPAAAPGHNAGQPMARAGERACGPLAGRTRKGTDQHPMSCPPKAPRPVCRGAKFLPLTRGGALSLPVHMPHRSDAVPRSIPASQVPRSAAAHATPKAGKAGDKTNEHNGRPVAAPELATPAKAVGHRSRPVAAPELATPAKAVGHRSRPVAAPGLTTPTKAVGHRSRPVAAPELATPAKAVGAPRQTGGGTWAHNSGKGRGGTAADQTGGGTSDDKDRGHCGKTPAELSPNNTSRHGRDRGVGVPPPIRCGAHGLCRSCEPMCRHRSGAVSGAAWHHRGVHVSPCRGEHGSAWTWSPQLVSFPKPCKHNGLPSRLPRVA